MPDKFKLEIELGNAAMQTPEDVADALRRVADTLAGVGFVAGAGGFGRGSQRIRDLNGNTVGDWMVI
jgi:hypothetical protein